MKKVKTSYNEGVIYGSLKHETFEGDTFYICPKCRREVLSTFMFNIGGEDMCMDCAEEFHQKYNH